MANRKLAEERKQLEARDLASSRVPAETGNFGQAPEWSPKRQFLGMLDEAIDEGWRRLENLRKLRKRVDSGSERDAQLLIEANALLK